MSFFSFLQVFEWRIWNRCLGVGRRKLFRKCFCSYIELKKECCECLKRSFCSFFQSFGWRSWNHFLGKCGKAFKAVKSKCDHRKLLLNSFVTTLSSKAKVLSFWKDYFQIFGKFWLTKLKLFPAKIRKSISNCLNQSLIKGRFLDSGFEATLSSKRNVVSVWKGQFPDISKVLSDEVATICWEGELKRSKLLKSKFDNRKILTKWFWSYLELKKECCEHLKRAVFSFFQSFQWQNSKHFLRKWAKAFKTI